MPWCDDCSKFWAPTAMNPDGSCPSCARVLERVERRGAGADDDARTPWHFWLLLAGVVLYLAWRLIQLVAAVL